MKRNKNKIKQSYQSIIFDVFNVILMFLLMLVTLYPMFYVLCASFSDNTLLLQNPGIMLWPKGFTTGAYKIAFEHPLILSGFVNSVMILAISLPINITLTLLCGYFMASKNMIFKKPIIAFMMFTMFFSGGLIPGYLNIRSLGLYNSLAALILPGALSLYNSIICRTAIESIPDSLVESADIDGANDFVILGRIIAPLIMPTLAVLLLYYGVGIWNSWFGASIYIVDNAKMPIQNILRSLLIANSDILNATVASDDSVDSYAESIKYSAIIISTVPILCIYPFLQKYFVKGVMIGAVKG